MEILVFISEHPVLMAAVMVVLITGVMWTCWWMGFKEGEARGRTAKFHVSVMKILDGVAREVPYDENGDVAPPVRRMSHGEMVQLEQEARNKQEKNNG